jgi:hypothetical protein
MDTTADVPMCPRHPRREAEPVLCGDCIDQVRTAIWRLPEQHRQLLGVRHATRTRAERRSAGGAPPSISPHFDHADDITRALDTWARHWAEHLDEETPHSWNPFDTPVGIQDVPKGLFATQADYVWEKVRRARAYYDCQHGHAPRQPLKPDTAARLLLDSRRGNPLAIPGAAEALTADMLRLHRTAARLLGDQDDKPKPTHRRAAGPCPACGAKTLYRTADSDRIRCHECPASLTENEYAAYARVLADAYRGAA